MDGEVRAELDRIHDEESRQNHRIEALEIKQNSLADLTVSVKELAINTKYTAQKVENIDVRLASIEKEPIRTMKEAKDIVVKTIVAFVFGMVLTALAWLVANYGGV